MIQITGHAGAGALAPANSLAGFQIALDCAVDRIEFDVFYHNQQLWLAHDVDHVQNAVTLAEGLEFLAAHDVLLSCDIKNAGAESEIAQMLLHYDVQDRTLICGHDRAVLDLVAADCPGVVRGWSLPQPSAAVAVVEVPWPPEHAVTVGWRERLPDLVVTHLQAGDMEGVMIQQSLITPQLVNAVHKAGGFIHAWTVDEPHIAVLLSAYRVDTITTNNPPLIQAALQQR